MPISQPAVPPPHKSRRFRRYYGDVPVRVMVQRSNYTTAAKARGNGLNAGGMAIYGWLGLVVGNRVEVELGPPVYSLPIRVPAVVRNCKEDCCGLEFLTAAPEAAALLKDLVRALAGPLDA